MNLSLKDEMQYDDRRELPSSCHYLIYFFMHFERQYMIFFYSLVRCFIVNVWSTVCELVSSTQTLLCGMIWKCIYKHNRIFNNTIFIFTSNLTTSQSTHPFKYINMSYWTIFFYIFFFIIFLTFLIKKRQ